MRGECSEGSVEVRRFLNKHIGRILKKREAEEAEKVEVAPGVTGCSMLETLSSRVDLTNPRTPKATSIVPLEKAETLRVRSVVEAMRLGAWLRSGEGIGWLAAGTIPNSLYRVPFFYLFWHVYFVIVPIFLSLICFVFCFFALVGAL